jgi:hypothetical protein
MKPFASLTFALILLSAPFCVSAEPGDSFTTDKWLAALDSKNAIDVAEAQGVTAGILMGLDADIRGHNSAGDFANTVFCIPAPLNAPGAVRILRPIIESHPEWRDKLTSVSIFLAAKAAWPAPCSGASL